MASAAFGAHAGKNIQQYRNNILSEGLSIAREIKTLAKSYFVCNANVWLIGDVAELKSALAEVDSDLTEAASWAYILAGEIRKSGLKNYSPKITIPDSSYKRSLVIDPDTAGSILSKMNKSVLDIKTNNDGLSRVKAEIAAIRPEDIRMNDIELMAAVFMSKGISRYKTVVQVKNHISELLGKSIKEINRILAMMTLTTMVVSSQSAMFQGVEQKAKLAMFDYALKLSGAMQRPNHATKKNAKLAIEELEKAQAEYVAIYGEESPEIAAEIARVRDLRIEQAIQEGIEKTGQDGTEFKEWFYRQYGGLNPKKDFHWCDRYSSWLVGQMGYRLPEGGCGYQRDYFKKYNAWHSEPDYQPKNGDVVYFNWKGTNSAQHVGVIHIADNGEIYVIQGNYGGKVAYVKLSDMLKDKNKQGKHVIGYGDPTKLPKLKTEK